MKFLGSDVIKRLAPSLGLEVNLVPGYKLAGQIITPKGKKIYFRNNSFNLNPHGSVAIAKDKNFSRFFLKKMGYKVPIEDTFFSEEWRTYIGSNKDINKAYEYATKIGFPVFVKPNSRSEGVGVSMVFNKEEFFQAMNYIFNTLKTKVALVQKPILGDDYRIIVLDDEVIAAYRRSPLNIIGDGKSTIKILIENKINELRIKKKSSPVRETDPRIALNIQREGYSLDSTAPKSSVIKLLNNANLSTGGDALDVTDTIHPTYKDLAIRLVRDMGLRLCGVDLITPSPINQPVKNYTILEINASPGMRFYTELGEKQKKVIENLYEKILHKVIEKTE